MRPWTSLATTTSLTANAGALARRARPARSRARTTRSSPASARRTAVSSSPGSAVVRKPTRPKLTPKTGTPLPGHLLQGAQHGAVAAEHDHEVGLRDVGVGRQQLDARLGREARDDVGGVAGAAARLQRHAAHGEAVRRRHRAAAVADRPGRSPPPGGRSRRCAGRTRDCRPGRGGRSRRRRARRRRPRVAASATRSSTAAVDAGVAHDALAHLVPPRLELRLDHRQQAVRDARARRRAAAARAPGR